MKAPAWIARMNRRERSLSLLVAGVLFLLINFLLWTWLLGAVSRARTDLADLHDESRDWLAARGRLDRSARPAPETRQRPPGGSRPSGRGRDRGTPAADRRRA